MLAATQFTQLASARVITTNYSAQSIDGYCWIQGTTINGSTASGCGTTQNAATAGNFWQPIIPEVYERDRAFLSCDTSSIDDTANIRSIQVYYYPEYNSGNNPCEDWFSGADCWGTSLGIDDWNRCTTGEGTWCATQGVWGLVTDITTASVSKTGSTQFRVVHYQEDTYTPAYNLTNITTQESPTANYYVCEVTYDVNDAPSVSLTQPANASSQSNATVQFEYVPIEYVFGDGGGYTNCSILVFPANNSFQEEVLNASPISNNSVNYIMVNLSSTGTWVFQASCWDNASTPLRGWSNNITVTYFAAAVIDVTINCTIVGWGTLNPGVVNQTPTGALNPQACYPLNVTINRNTNVVTDLFVNGSNMLKGGDVLGVKNTTYSNLSNLTGTPAGKWTQLNATLTAGDPIHTNWWCIDPPHGEAIQRDVFFMLSVPGYQPKGTYSGTAYVSVTEHSGLCGV